MGTLLGSTNSWFVPDGVMIRIVRNLPITLVTIPVMNASPVLSVKVIISIASLVFGLYFTLTLELVFSIERDACCPAIIVIASLGTFKIINSLVSVVIDMIGGLKFVVTLDSVPEISPS